MKNPQQALVEQFHRSMKLEVAETPAPLSADALARRKKLIEEELAEFITAAQSDSLPDTIKEVCDLLYVVYGTLVELGVESAPFFAEVHRSNMTKVNGWRRADGKWMKPADYIPADMEAIFLQVYGQTSAAEREP
ncbi:MAG TPA: hypothetical protein PK299_05385 [Anaerolineales bacterium]|nr:hypothetical protein [Anaerolineales bacterium]